MPAADVLPAAQALAAEMAVAAPLANRATKRALARSLDATIEDGTITLVTDWRELPDTSGDVEFSILLGSNDLDENGEPDDAFAYTSLSIFLQRKGLVPEAEKAAAKARMISWKEELKKNPNAPPPGPPGSMNVVQ